MAPRLSIRVSRFPLKKKQESHREGHHQDQSDVIRVEAPLTTAEASQALSRELEVEDGLGKHDQNPDARHERPHEKREVMDVSDRDDDQKKEEQVPAEHFQDVACGTAQGETENRGRASETEENEDPFGRVRGRHVLPRNQRWLEKRQRKAESQKGHSGSEEADRTQVHLDRADVDHHDAEHAYANRVSRRRQRDAQQRGGGQGIPPTPSRRAGVRPQRISGQW